MKDLENRWPTVCNYLLTFFTRLELHFLVRSFFLRKYIFKVQLFCRIQNSGRLFVNYYFLESGRRSCRLVQNDRV